MNSPKISLRQTVFKSKYKENLLCVNAVNPNMVMDDKGDEIIYLSSEISQLIAKLLLDATVYVELSKLFKISLNKSIEFLQVIIVENMSKEDFQQQKLINKNNSLFTYFSNENFSWIDFISPSSSKICGLDEFLTIPIKNLTSHGCELIGHLVKQLTPQILLSTPSEMFWDSVPCPVRDSNRDVSSFIFSQDYYSIPDNDPNNLIAIDCEMVNTGNEKDLELARLSVVRCNGSDDLKTVKGIKQWLSLSKKSAYQTIYDVLVKPKGKVVDYLTKYSGITESTLENVQTTLADVQIALKNLIKSNTILVGHSIQSDLKALKIYHPYIIDTSTIYNMSGDFTRKPGLKPLCIEILKQEIRKNGKKLGHDPIEDAQAALRLVIVKLSKDLNFGNKTRGTFTSPNSMMGEWKEVEKEQPNKIKKKPETIVYPVQRKTPFKCVLECEESTNGIDIDNQMKLDKFTLLKEQPAVVKTTEVLFKLKKSLQLIVNARGIIGQHQRNNTCQSIVKMHSDEDVVQETIHNFHKTDSVISVLSDYSDIDYHSSEFELKNKKMISIRENISRLATEIPKKSAIFVILPGRNELGSTGKFFWKIS